MTMKNTCPHCGVPDTSDIEALESVAENFYSEIRGYSGRGMDGAYCVGISIKDHDPEDALRDAAEKGVFGGYVDSLGKGFIVYWPRVPWPEETE